MIELRRPKVHAPAACLALSLVLLLVPYDASRLVEADGEEKPAASVLVKVAPEKVDGLVAYVAGVGGEAYELQTMKRLTAPAAETERGLRDVAEVAGALHEVLTQQGLGTGPEAALLLAGLRVDQRRATLELSAKALAGLERLTDALARDARLAGHLGTGTVEIGSLEAQAGRRWEASVRLHFAGRANAAFEGAKAISLADVAKQVDEAGLRLLRTSSEGVDVDRRAGTVTRSREFLLHGGRLEQLLELMRSLSENSGVVVTQAKSSGGKLSFQLATQQPLDK